MITKKLVLLLLILPAYIYGSAQINTVQWSFSAKKIADNTYELHFTATVQSPWHIYSQATPEDGPLPTKFSFTKNPLLTREGKVKEIGKLVKKHEKVFEVDVLYFEGSVDFVQIVKMKANAITKMSGSVEFMACNDRQCQPRTEIPFSIGLN